MRNFSSCLLAALLLALPFWSLAQGVGIGTTAPDASAALDIRATAKGVLVPRLTAAQRTGIAAPATGLLVYQTDGTQVGFWYYVSSGGWTFLNPTGAGDNLGSHTATQNLNLQANALVGTGASIGTAVGLGVRADGGLNLGQNTVGNNFFLGYQNGQANSYNASSDAGLANQFVGYQSGANNTTGSYNMFSGYQSGYSNTRGIYNEFSGWQSGLSNDSGQNNSFNGTNSGYHNTNGSINTFTGAASGFGTTTGSYNTFEGAAAGQYNTTGNNNTALGYVAGPASTSTALVNTTALGNGATVTASNTIRLGNSAITGLFCNVNLMATSDARFKYDVRPTVPGLAFITKLRPVTYRLDTAQLAAFERTGKLSASRSDTAAALHTGFLAQQVAQVAKSLHYDFDGVHAPANARDHYSLGYSQFVVPLVKAVQEQQAQIDALKTENDALKAALKTQAGQTTAQADQTTALSRRLAALEAQLAPRADGR